MLPGFGAEDSLYQSRVAYAGGMDASPGGGLIGPASVWCVSGGGGTRCQEITGVMDGLLTGVVIGGGLFGGLGALIGGLLGGLGCWIFGGCD